MGKNPATVVNKCNDKNPKKKKKKKGRPSLLDIQKRALRLIKQQQQQNPNSGNQTRSTNTSCLHFPTSSNILGFSSLPSISHPTPPSSTKKKSILVNVLPGSSGEMTGSQLLLKPKPKLKPKLEKDGTMELEELTTPLPDTLLLYFILDRLQNKDTYGVFSEPVDHEELPDYHDIIENPMDFSTVRKKLSDGAYPNLEAFEEDVFLISSNAMRYNSPDTIYFRQAKSIHDLAKKDFENLRQESDDESDDIYAPEPNNIQRGMPPVKSTMEMTNNSMHKALLSNAFIDKSIPGDSSVRVSQRACNRKSPIQLVDNKSDRNDESSVFMRSVSMRHQKKITVSEENHHNAYLHLEATHKPSVLTTFKGERKELIPVGLHMEHTYTRSLARFAANLGPVGWAIAANQIERVLCPGTEFGRGWVEEYDLFQVGKIPTRLPRPKSRGCLVAPEALMTHSQALEMVSRGNSIISITHPAIATNNFESSKNNYLQIKLNNSDMVYDANNTKNKTIHSADGQPKTKIDSRNRIASHHYHPEITTTESHKSVVDFACPSLPTSKARICGI